MQFLIRIIFLYKNTKNQKKLIVLHTVLLYENWLQNIEPESKKGSFAQMCRKTGKKGHLLD